MENASLEGSQHDTGEIRIEAAPTLFDIGNVIYQ
jgi:hypothetical protein